MDLILHPARLRGTVMPPSSKSQAHRFLLCAALAEGESTIANVAFSQDIHATLHCMEALGAAWRQEGSTVVVRGIGRKPRPAAPPHFACGESGSTLRFLIPLALVLAGGGDFTGQGRLLARPQDPYKSLFVEKGVRWEEKEGLLSVRGTLTPGEYRLRGDISSQFFTGLLLALPMLDGPSLILPTTYLASFSYIGMTLDALEKFGISIPSTRSIPPQYRIAGKQYCQPRRVAVEGDWSQAAFWYAANALGSQVAITGMNENTLQGDVQIVSAVRALAAPGDVAIDITDCPDLAPPLAAIAAVREGTTRLTGTARLRIKESDRAAAIQDTLQALGTRVAVRPDALEIQGVSDLQGGVCIDCHNDHRIAMMAAVAATRCREDVVLRGAECVHKSYPAFWEDYRALGGSANEYTGK